MWSACLVVDDTYAPPLLVFNEVETVDASADGGGKVFLTTIDVDGHHHVFLQSEDSEGSKRHVDAQEATQIGDDHLAMDDL